MPYKTKKEIKIPYNIHLYYYARKLFAMRHRCNFSFGYR